MNTATNLDPRIGVLNSGLFYAFANGYDKPETIGTLDQVQAALGIPAKPVQEEKAPRRVINTYNVLLKFECPAWDTSEGIVYEAITAISKKEAIKAARVMASNDGHTIGCGRHWFTATKSE